MKDSSMEVATPTTPDLPFFPQLLRGVSVNSANFATGLLEAWIKKAGMSFIDRENLERRSVCCHVIASLVSRTVRSLVFRNRAPHRACSVEVRDWLSRVLDAVSVSSVLSDGESSGFVERNGFFNC